MSRICSRDRKFRKQTSRGAILKSRKEPIRVLARAVATDRKRLESNDGFVGKGI